MGSLGLRTKFPPPMAGEGGGRSEGFQRGLFALFLSGDLEDSSLRLLRLSLGQGGEGGLRLIVVRPGAEGEPFSTGTPEDPNFTVYSPISWWSFPLRS